VQSRESARREEIQNDERKSRETSEESNIPRKASICVQSVSIPVDLTDLVELVHASFESRRHLIEQCEKGRGHNTVLAVTELTTHLTGRIEKENDGPRLGVCERNIIW
jgi:hypothetical protein